MTWHLVARAENALPLWLITEAGFKAWAKSQTPATRTWLDATGFRGQAGRIATLPDEDGRLRGAVGGISAAPDLWSFAHLPQALPAVEWQVATPLKGPLATQAALGFALGTYAFGRYRKAEPAKLASLVWPKAADRALVERLAGAICMARDLVNVPAGDLGPAELALAATDLAKTHGAACEVIVGDDLLAENYPLVHAVGRASSRAPRLIDIRWGSPKAPKVTLVGKGVCFDSGGLDLKPSSGMLMMKKDMGGAAVVLGVARAIMDAKLKVCLRVLIPAVENAVSGNAFRPMDIIKSRAGITVEIGNTDAEGRLILADALTEAVSDKPDLLIDCATLTGAARVAVGPDLPALFTDDEKLAADLLRLGVELADPMWRLPLYAPYRALLNSGLADINNAGEGGFAGAITAALFLKDFAGKAKSWAHIDLYAWNQKARPGRPAGGEAMALRAIYALVAERYGQ